MIITLDGPAASGKGTLAKRLAHHFGLPHLDTGLLYRIVALDVTRGGRHVTDIDKAVAAAERIEIDRFDEADLRGPGMGELASIVSAIPEVRSALMRFQVDFANQPGGSVLDGRDCGTVIAPHAAIKIFVTADPEIRAERRTRELLQRGEQVTREDVLADIRRRDERDSSRGTAPLKAADDAWWLDTSHMGVEEMVEFAINGIERQNVVAL